MEGETPASHPAGEGHKELPVFDNVENEPLAK